MGIYNLSRGCYINIIEAENSLAKFTWDRWIQELGGDQVPDIVIVIMYL